VTQIKFILTASLLFFIAKNCYAQQKSQGTSSVFGVFAGSTPCSPVSRPLPGIPVNTDCDVIKWKVTLYHDQSTKTPTTYKLHSIYGLPEPGTTGFIGGGKQIDIEGKWTIDKSTAPPGRKIVYRLEDSGTKKVISFLRLSDNVLHLLDSDQQLMIGSAAWSYTLNRIDNK